MANNINISLLDLWRPNWLRGKGLTEQDKPRRGVLHITGRTTYLNAEKKQKPPLEYLGYDNFLLPGHSFSNYAIDPWGTIAVYAPENIRPWSQGWGKYGGKKLLMSRIHSGEYVVPDWWFDNWVGRAGLEKNRVVGNLDDLVYSDDNSPNSRSFSVEFIQYGNQYLLTEAQYISGHALCLEVCLRNGIPFASPWMLGHEDIDPFLYPPGRGDRHGGWDPGARRVKPRFCWRCMLTGNREHSGTLCNCILPTPEKPEWAQMESVK